MMRSPDRWKRYIPDNYIRRAVYIEQYGVASKVDWSLDGLVGTDLDAVDHYPARLIEDDEGRLVSRHACLQVGLRQSLDMTDACIVGGAFACPGRGATEPDGAVDSQAGARLPRVARPDAHHRRQHKQKDPHPAALGREHIQPQTSGSHIVPCFASITTGQ